MARELVLREKFLDGLLEIEAYLGSVYWLKKNRKFPNDIIGFISDIIANNPFALCNMKSVFLKIQIIKKRYF